MAIIVIVYVDASLAGAGRGVPAGPVQRGAFSYAKAFWGWGVAVNLGASGSKEDKRQWWWNH
jgi:hypothetical protein